MHRHSIALPALLAVLLAGCSSNDPRLAEQLYGEAVKLSQDGHTQEAKTLMARIAKDFPDQPAGRKAQQDLHLLEAFHSRDVKEKQKATRLALGRIIAALKRYQAAKGEYPADLAILVPDYLDKVPESPWGHPFFYRPYVGVPVQEVKDRRGITSQKFNTKYDHYHLACLGTNLAPGGTELAEDLLVEDGEYLARGPFNPIPAPQPLR